MSIPIYKGIFDSSKSYPELSIVQDSNTQNSILYISTKTVPTGSSLFDPTYWVKYNKSCGLTEGEVEEMITSYCGDLDDLSTEDKSSLVNAINELDDEHEALSETVSDIVEGTIAVGVQSDWEQDDTDAKDFIKNKPFDEVDNDTIKVNENGELYADINVPIATTEIAGKVKPDGTSITIDNDGTIHSQGGSQGEWTKIQGIAKASSGGTSLNFEFNEIRFVYFTYTGSSGSSGCQILSTPIFTKQMLDDIFTQFSGTSEINAGASEYYSNTEVGVIVYSITKNNNIYNVGRPESYYRGGSSFVPEFNRCYIYYR